MIGVAGPLADDAPPDTPAVLRAGCTHDEYLARVRAAGDVLALQIVRGGSWAPGVKERTLDALQQVVAERCGRTAWCSCRHCTAPPTPQPMLERVRNFARRISGGERVRTTAA